MSKARISAIIASAIIFSVLFTILTISDYSEEINDCEKWTVQEKIYHTVQLDSLTRKQVQSYLISCNGTQKRIQTDKNFKLKQQIRKEWNKVEY